ncbi:MAG TPA: hypothetical protein VF406_19195, partial [Thermodesulfobacteriota bacterium]
MLATPRKDGPAAGLPGAFETDAAADARHEALRRLCGTAIVLGAFAVALAFHVGGLSSGHPRGIVAVVMLAVSTGVFVLTFPWSRFDPRWFLAVVPPVDALIAWAAALTGGAASPMLYFTFVVAAFVGAYGGGLLPGALVAATALVPWLAGRLAGADAGPAIGQTLVLAAALAAVAAAARVAARTAAPRPSDAPAAPTPPTGRTPPPPAGAPDAAAPLPRLIDDAVLSSLSLDGVLDQLLGGAADRMGVARVALRLEGGSPLDFAARQVEPVAAGAVARGVLPRPAPAALALELPVAIGGERLGTLCVYQPAGA